LPSLINPIFAELGENILAVPLHVSADAIRYSPNLARTFSLCHFTFRQTAWPRHGRVSDTLET
jgi:hypothetical protein